MDAEKNRRTLNILEASDSQPKLDVDPLYPELNLGDPKPLMMTEPLPIPIRGGGKGGPCVGIGSPMSPTHPGPGSPGGLSIPHHLFHEGNIITKRNRSNSTYEKAKDNPVERGIIKYFSRSKGHGFIAHEAGGEDVFVHVSDIEGELVPRAGDEVTYKLCPIPPKMEKFQAIHVRIMNFTPEVHLRWDSPLREEEKKDLSPDTYVT